MLPWYYTIDMEENTIFGQNQSNQQIFGAVPPQQPQENQTGIIQPSVQDTTQANTVGAPPPPQPPLETPSESQQNNQGNSFPFVKTILKIFLGLIVVGTLFFLFYIFYYLVLQNLL